MRAVVIPSRRLLPRLAVGLGAISPLTPGRAAPPDGATPNAIIRLYEPGQAELKDGVRAVAIDDRGTLIVGSNELSAFNGYAWQRIEVPGAYGFRALAASRSPAARPAAARVWVGAIDHLGYTERGDDGRWRFVDLTARYLGEHPAGSIGDVWSVHALAAPADSATHRAPAAAGGAVWVTTNQVIRWDGVKFDRWTLPSTSHLSGFSLGDTALVYQPGAGLLEVGLAGAPVLIVPETVLPEKPVTWLLPAEGGQGMLVGLRDDAYAWTRPSGWKRLDGLSAALRGTLPTSAVRLESDRIAVGTFNAGILLASNDGIVLGWINAAAGLPEDSVYALTRVHDRLFAGVPSGLARIDGAGLAGSFERRSTFHAGSPRRVLSYRDATYVVATNGVYDASQERLRLVAAHDTPLWDGATAAGQLWVGGFGGAWRVTDHGLSRELHVANDVFQLTNSSHARQAVLLTVGYHLNLLRPSPHGGWANVELEDRLRDTPVSLIEDARGDVWISMVKDGIARFRWSDRSTDGSPQLELATFFHPGIGLPPDATKPVLVRFGDHLYAFTEQGILVCDEGARRFLPVNALSGYVGVAAAETEQRASEYWLVQAKPLLRFGTYAIVRVTQNATGLRLQPVNAPGLDTIGPIIAMDRTSEPDGGVLWFSGARGLLRVNEGALQEFAGSEPPALTPITPHEAAGSDGSVHYAAGTRRIGFSYVAANATLGEPVFYETRLDGADNEWSAPMREAEREFANLAPGHYAFAVRGIDRFGRASAPVTQAFVVLTPWWRRPEALVGYGILLIGIVAAGARWRIRRLQRQNEKLNRLVTERTRELELSNTAKSEFLENISHEIRNPLNGLTGMLNLMREDQLGLRERDLARSLKSAASTLTRVFEDVLEFSKLEYGYGKLHVAPFSLRAALDELVALHRPLAAAQGCDLVMQWPAGLADGFAGDAERIKTIVGNFVGNALKYAPAAPVHISVSSTGETNGLVDLYIDVKDHGPGIPPEEQGLIFKKFVRGSNAKQERIAGTGLGLATCHALARMMNGHVGVESTPGRGAMFYLRLLLRRAALPEDPTQPPPAAPLADAPVLVVDDEDYNRTVLAGIALELGLKPDVAPNGAEALALVTQREYAAIFLDWELPGLKGGDLARLVRGRPGGERPIILATTAHDSDQIRDECSAAGMDGFLTKPFDAPSLRRAIEAARSRRQARRPGATPPPPLASEHAAPARRPVANGAALDLSPFAGYDRVRPGEGRRAYLAALDERRAELARAVESRDLSAISTVAHRFRALSGLIGAEALNAAAARAEALARAGAVDESLAASAVVLDTSATLRRQLAGMAPTTATTPGGDA